MRRAFIQLMAMCHAWTGEDEMSQTQCPIAPGLWTDEPSPRLIGGRLSNGRIVFPMPTGDAAQGIDVFPLSRIGKLWSWTRQDFKPKEPYSGPDVFEPFLLGYVELPNEIIVETRIVDAKLEDLKLGMAMEFVVTPFDERRSTYAFRPERKS
jgi:uncharacterized protein